MRSRWQPSDGFYGLERWSLVGIAAVTALVALGMVRTALNDPSWLQVALLPLPAYGMACWWRAALAHRADRPQAR